MALVAEFGADLGRRLVLGLRSDRAKERNLVLGDEIHGRFRQGIPLLHPVVPTDTSRDPIGLEAGRLEYAQGLRQHHVSDSVTRHYHYRSSRHVLFLHVMRDFQPLAGATIPKEA
jgi:hypothetical protein